jgi:hypothetical protein
MVMEEKLEDQHLHLVFQLIIPKISKCYFLNLFDLISTIIDKTDITF